MAGKSVQASRRETAASPGGGFLSQVRGMLGALLASQQRNMILLLVVALIAVVGATAFAQVRLNAWNEPFYDSLAHKNFPEFVQQLIVFAELAGVLLALNVAQMWLIQKSKLVLREGLVEDLLAQWLSPLRAYRLSHSGEIGANPDQRIQEDAKHLTELTTDLWIGLLQSTLLLLSSSVCSGSCRTRWSSRWPVFPLSRRASWSGARSSTRAWPRSSAGASVGR